MDRSNVSASAILDIRSVTWLPPPIFTSSSRVASLAHSAPISLVASCFPQVGRTSTSRLKAGSHAVSCSGSTRVLVAADSASRARGHDVSQRRVDACSSSMRATPRFLTRGFRRVRTVPFGWCVLSANKRGSRSISRCAQAGLNWLSHSMHHTRVMPHVFGNSSENAKLDLCWSGTSHLSQRL